MSFYQDSIIFYKCDINAKWVLAEVNFLLSQIFLVLDVGGWGRARMLFLVKHTKNSTPST